jgi:16S rRNA (cytidine1402-2'-O)-methyltransferase
VVVGRELTKAHEELVIRPISDHLRAPSDGRGEFTLVVAPSSELAEVQPAPAASAIGVEFGYLTETKGLSRREAIRALATKYGIKTREAYNLVEQATK